MTARNPPSPRHLRHWQRKRHQRRLKVAERTCGLIAVGKMRENPWDWYIRLHENHKKSSIHVAKYTIVPWILGPMGSEEDLS